MNSLMETDLASGLQFLHDGTSPLCINGTSLIPNPTKDCKFGADFWDASVKGLGARDVALLVVESICLAAMIICFFRGKSKLLRFAIFATALALVLSIISIIMKGLFEVIQLCYIILFIFLGLSWRGAEWTAALLLKQTISSTIDKDSIYFGTFSKAFMTLKVCLGISIVLSLASYALTTAFNIMFLLRLKGHKYMNIERYLSYAKKVTFSYEIMFTLFAATALATLVLAMRCGWSNALGLAQKRFLYIVTIALLVRGLEQIIVTAYPAFIASYDEVTLKLADAFAYNLATTIMFWFLAQYTRRSKDTESQLSTTSTIESQHGPSAFDGAEGKKTILVTTYALEDANTGDDTNHVVQSNSLNKYPVACNF